MFSDLLDRIFKTMSENDLEPPTNYLPKNWNERILKYDSITKSGKTISFATENAINCGIELLLSAIIRFPNYNLRRKLFELVMYYDVSAFNKLKMILSF